MAKPVRFGDTSFNFGANVVRKPPARKPPRKASGRKGGKSGS